MTETEKPDRREILMSSLLLPLAAGGGGTLSDRRGAAARAERSPGGVLHPERQHAHRRRPAQPRSPGRPVRDRAGDPYPADYFATVEQATQERERNDLPPLRRSVGNLAAYETIFLGFPIWAASAPPVIRSFLTNQDFAGKTSRALQSARRLWPGEQPRSHCTGRAASTLRRRLCHGRSAGAPHYRARSRLAGAGNLKS